MRKHFRHQHSFMIKPLKLGIEGHFLNLTGGIYNIFTANTFNDGMNVLSLKSGIRQVYLLSSLFFSLSSLLFNTALEVLDRIMRQDKEINSIHIAKEEVKLCLFIDDITVYIENPKESNKKLS